MIILGLGSNVGDRLHHLRQALIALQTADSGVRVLQVSPVYQSDALLPEGCTDPLWHRPYLNAAVRCESTLEPQALLARIKALEQKLGREQHAPRWSPRVIDIDILVMDEIELRTDALTLPHAELKQRPFALWPLNDVAPLWRLAEFHDALTAFGSRYTGSAPFRTRQIMQRIDTPQLVGILNVTHNSFSDGGLFNDAERAAQQINHLIASGAEIIDIGAEATSPHATPITLEEEWARLKPILASLERRKREAHDAIQPKVSVDTYHPKTAALAIEHGADWINDVTGFADPTMRAVLSEAPAVDCVMMHHVSIPASNQHIVARDKNPIEVIYHWGERRIAELQEVGIASSRIIFDPGIGFGKVPEHSFQLIQAAATFKPLNVRLLYGHSRKLFLGRLTAKSFAERDLETAGISTFLQRQGVDYLRVHDVEMTARLMRIQQALL